MPNILQTVKGNINFIIRFLPVLSFSMPLFILYSLYGYTFDQTYQGRTFQLFFLWLAFLEIILGWEELQENKLNRLKSKRTILYIAALILPTIYVVVANYYGLKVWIENLANQIISAQDPLKIVHVSCIPISIEYLVFTVFFSLMILLAYGINSLPDFSISIFFLGSIGMLFTIDNLYPGGRFTPLQIPVPLTTSLAANVLNIMGYRTSVSMGQDPFYGLMPNLFAVDPRNPIRHAGFTIAWPCAGVESLLLYTVTILLFLKKTEISWRIRAIYFAIGGVVTYFINVLRVVTIFLLAMDYGFPSPQVQRFHDNYGMLYSISWIVSYPLIIIGSRMLWSKIKNRNRTRTEDSNFAAAKAV